MKAYETSATIGKQGELRVDGLPFAPGTDVQVTVTEVASPQASNAEATVIASRERMRQLFDRIRGYRGASMLRREDLYDRRGLH